MITELWDPSSALALAIPHQPCSRFFKWERSGGIVYLAVNQRGDVLECHLAADRRGKRQLRVAVNQLSQWLFMSCPTANRIVSYAMKNSMKNLVRKCGFRLVARLVCASADRAELEILMRCR